MTGKPLSPAEQIAGYLKLTSAFFYLRLTYNKHDTDLQVDELFACRRLLGMEMSAEDRNLAYKLSIDGSDRYEVAA